MTGSLDSDNSYIKNLLKDLEGDQKLKKDLFQPDELKRPSPWTEPSAKPSPEPGAEWKLPKINIEGSDKKTERPPPSKPETPPKTLEYFLKNSSGGHSKLDMVMRLPANFDPSKPINVAIYHHGWYSSAKSAYESNQMNKQMQDAPANTILIVPEWQLYPGSGGRKLGPLQGRYQAEKFIERMLQESFDKTPELKGKKIDDISSISIFSHSGGYRPTESFLNNNPKIAGKVTSITMLDSAYGTAATNEWIRNNIYDLASGKKQYHNIFDDTYSESVEQEKFVRKLLKDSSLPDRELRKDLSNPKQLLDANDFASSSIVFKHSQVKIGDNTPHWSIPMTYIEAVEVGAARKAGKK